MSALQSIAQQLISMADHHTLIGMTLFVGIHVAFAILVLPCSPLTALAGALWGPSQGFLISLTGALSASSLTFIIGRALAHTRVAARLRDKLGPNAHRIAGAVRNSGWLPLFLIQVNPLVPASSSGYLFGAMQVSFTGFFCGTAGGIIISQILLVGFGASLRDAALVGHMEYVAIVGFLVTGLLILKLRRGAGRKNCD